VLSQALSDVTSGIPAYSITSTGTSLITQAQRVLAHVNTSMAGTPSSIDKQQFANQIDALVQPAARTVRSLFDALWTSVNLSAEITRRIRDEISVLVALEGRDGMELRVDLLRMLGRGIVDAAAVTNFLWPAYKQYRVALVVSGTRALEGLDQLLPEAQ
jgi:hypothetical protein